MLPRAGRGTPGLTGCYDDGAARPMSEEKQKKKERQKNET